MALSRDLVGASTPPLVLAILKRGPSYGYAIVKEVRDRSEGLLEWTEGMLYPVLHRLERDGLIHGFDQLADNGRTRRYYELTRAGRKELERQRSDWKAINAVLASAWEA
jgi:DNA-binding PadR family transcriptional regulator